MSKLDQGYKPARPSRSGGGGYGRGVSLSTYLEKARKSELADLHLRVALRGILDALGIEAGSEQAMTIKQGLLEDMANKKMTKADIGAATNAEQSGIQAVNRNATEIRRLESAQVLVAALQSATRAAHRENLDEGDILDDVASLLLDGSGWAEEVVSASQYKKHVSIAIDNSGSTRMPETGFCSRAIQSVAQNLQEVLYSAASQWPGVTWDVFSFNKTVESHTGRFGRITREREARQQLENVVVDDPHHEDATQTNLAPLIQRMYENEVDRGLIGDPRLDIIITDGEFESQEDADEAAEWQRKRGPNVSTYVLNMWPGNPSDVTLPNQFQVVPVACIANPGEFIAEVDEDMLRLAMMRVVEEEVTRGS